MDVFVNTLGKGMTVESIRLQLSPIVNPEDPKDVKAWQFVVYFPDGNALGIYLERWQRTNFIEKLRELVLEYDNIAK